jgi:ADP-ribose pyrophosphatase YjhB (NUDIX family)
MLKQDTIIKHFTATVFIVKDSKLLLLEHKKIGTWLPPGGHVEDNELPSEAAIREAKEETGFDIELITTADFINEQQYLAGIDNRASLIPGPWRVLLEEITNKHYHIDCLYLAKIVNKAAKASENHEMHWLTMYELEQSQNIFPNVKFYGIKAIKIANSESNLYE